MTLTAVEYKNQGNEYYFKNESLLAIESYSKAIKRVEMNSEENVPLYLLYSNRSAAYIQDKNYYSGYKDAKYSLKLKKNENLKGFYRAAVCAYHLGFIEKSEGFIKEATKTHPENLLDYLELKFLIEKKLNCMKRWRKPVATAKKGLKNLEKIFEKGILMFEVPAILYQIRYILRAYFDKTKDQKLMNMNTGDFGLRLHELAIQFTLQFDVEKILKSDPLFEDLILNEMPDVGSLRLQVYKQRNFPYDDQFKDLEKKANDDLAAHEFSFFVANVLASLVVHSSDENMSLRALKQLHRLTTIDLYRKALGDALSDAMNNYIYSQSNNSLVLNKFVLNGGIDILFYDFIEASYHLAASRMIGNITEDQWKQQSSTTIQFVLQQLSKKIRHQDMESIEPRESARYEKKVQELLGIHSTAENRKEVFLIIINVLTKILMIFGKQPFIDQSLHDPLFFYVKQIWLEKVNIDQHRYDMPFLLDSWPKIISEWIKLDYDNRRQITIHQSDNN